MSKPASKESLAASLKKYMDAPTEQVSIKKPAAAVPVRKRPSADVDKLDSGLTDKLPKQIGQAWSARKSKGQLPEWVEQYYEKEVCVSLFRCKLSCLYSECLSVHSHVFILNV